jgi:hypothetical protein
MHVPRTPHAASSHGGSPDRGRCVQRPADGVLKVGQFRKVKKVSLLLLMEYLK